MNVPSEKELADLLFNIVSDGFNRSLDALVQAGAIDTKKLKTQYKGVGSKYYDLVTEQVALTAKYGAIGLRKHWLSDSEHGKNNSFRSEVRPSGSADGGK